MCAVSATVRRKTTETTAAQSVWPRLGGPRCGVAADRIGELVVAADPHEVHEVALDRADEADAAKDEAGVELNEARAGLYLGERRRAGIDAADADQREAALHPHKGFGQHAGRQAKQRPSRQAAAFVRRCDHTFRP